MKKNKSMNKLALVLSVLMMLLWGVLGAGTTLAWFADEAEPVRNTFYFGTLDLKVGYKHPGEANYKELEGSSEVFNDEALYEPGYVQVVYLEIENIGDYTFDYTAAVIVGNYTTAVNVFGQSFNLQPYLNYGVVFADSEAELDAKLATRTQAREIAVNPLSNYTSDVDKLEVGDVKYMALVLQMPTSVGNEANYRENTVPQIELGISVKASQEGTLD